MMAQKSIPNSSSSLVDEMIKKEMRAMIQGDSFVQDIYSHFSNEEVRYAHQLIQDNLNNYSYPFAERYQELSDQSQREQEKNEDLSVIKQEYALIKSKITEMAKEAKQYENNIQLKLTKFQENVASIKNEINELYHERIVTNSLNLTTIMNNTF